MKEIVLSQGKVALIDDGDFKRVNQFKWSVGKQNRGWCAVRKVQRDNKSVKFFMHRFILDAPKGLDVDHINGNTLDNRRVNIRICTRRQNQQNQLSVHGLSKYKGVCWHHERWVARITVNNVRIHLGCFFLEEEAARVYDKAALEYFTEYAQTNRMLGLLEGIN